MALLSVLSNVGMMLFYMACAFLLVKGGKAKAEHGKSLSSILVYLGTPSLILSSFQEMPYSLPLFGNVMRFFAISFLVQLLFFLLLWWLLRRRMGRSKYRILTTAGVLGNAAFVGLPIITGLFPNDPMVSSYSVMYIVGMNILVFTLGVFMITQRKEYVSLKAAVLNPTFLSVVAAIALYLLRIQLPSGIKNGLSLLGKMTTPLCMFVLGMRLTTMDFKVIFGQFFSYAASLLKLVAFPAFAFLCVWFLPFLSQTEKVSVVVLSATPCAAVILSMAEIYGCEQKKCADAILVSTLLSVITIPLLVFVLGL